MATAGSRTGASSTRPGASPHPRPNPPPVNTQTKVFEPGHGRILCIADIRGRLTGLNDLAREHNADAIIHTGDFGFFETSSLERINDRTLRHLTMYSPLIQAAQRSPLIAPDVQPAALRQSVTVSMLSEFPQFVAGELKFDVPVYTVWGACEDVAVLEKIRLGTIDVPNLHVIDEATTRVLDLGGVKLRLFGLGGAFVPHKMFDNGDGQATIAGGQGTMWTTALQIGELVDTAQRVNDPTETRLLVTHASPGREGILAQLALVLKADLTISAGLHFRYASSYNEFSVQADFDGFRQKLIQGKAAFDKVWESVRGQVDAVIDEHQRVLLDKALFVADKTLAPLGAPGPNAPGEEPAWKNCWNWNLCDAAYGALVLDVKEGRVSAELKSQGFNYAYRRTATVQPTPNSATSTHAPALPSANAASSSAATPNAKPTPPHMSASAAAATPAARTPTPKVEAVVPSPQNGTNSLPTGATSTVNGSPASSAADKAAEKAEREKQKRKEKNQRKKEERAEKEKETVAGDTAATDGDTKAPKSGKATPLPEDGVKATPAEADGLLSPTDSAGGRTPKSGRPPRNPWTIYMRMEEPVAEADLRGFFLDSSAGIIRIHYPHPYKAGTSKIAYIEFGDEEAMRAGLEKHAEKLNDFVPQMSQAIEKSQRLENSGRGGRGGRGGTLGRRGGGYAARGFAAAGLTGRGRANSDGGAGERKD